MDNVTLLLRLSPRQAELLQKLVSSMSAREAAAMLAEMSWTDKDFANGKAPTVNEIQALLCEVFTQTVNVVGMRL